MVVVGAVGDAAGVGVFGDEMVEVRVYAGGGSSYDIAKQTAKLLETAHRGFWRVL